jgi:hypothetical protein
VTGGAAKVWSVPYEAGREASGHRQTAELPYSEVATTA